MAQITDTILMIAPLHFGYDEETADNNAFQSKDSQLSEEEIKFRAREEFQGFVEVLKEKGINILVIQDTPEPVKKDAVFPNNWFSSHKDGTLVTYPMQPPNRRAERRTDILDYLNTHFEVKQELHLEYWEQSNKFLESTGSLILDRPNKIAYGCRSVRTNELVVKDFATRLGYNYLLFDASDRNNIPIYHTNVMMALGEDFAIVALECIKKKVERKKLIDSLEKHNKKIIPISLEQVYNFAGNMLQVKNKKGESFLIMSSRAFDSLSSTQIDRINQFTQIIHYPIPTLEKFGGGSVRCMMAEVFLPKR